MIQFRILSHNPRDIELLGFIPQFFSYDDPRPAKEQINEAYAHGGGWHQFEGFRVTPGHSLQYPGDPAIHPIAKAALRDEMIYVYPHAWVMIVHADKTHSIARID